jgi:hypothetical protein
MSRYPQRYYVWHPPDCDTFPWFVCDTQRPPRQKTIARFRDENSARRMAHRFNREAVEAEAGGGSVPSEVMKLFAEAATAIGAARRLIAKNYLSPSTGSIAHTPTLRGLESLLKILARVMQEDLKTQWMEPLKSVTDPVLPQSEEEDEDDADEEAGPGR